MNQRTVGYPSTSWASCFYIYSIIRHYNVMKTTECKNLKYQKRQMGHRLPIYFQGAEYMIRKIADGRMAPAPGEIRTALPDTSQSSIALAAVALTVAAPASAPASSSGESLSESVGSAYRIQIAAVCSHAVAHRFQKYMYVNYVMFRYPYT